MAAYLLFLLGAAQCPDAAVKATWMSTGEKLLRRCLLVCLLTGDVQL